MKDIWYKYSSKITSTGISEHPFESDIYSYKPLPHLTFCPLKGFRNKGFHYMEKSFLKETFDKVRIAIYFFNIESPMYLFIAFNFNFFMQS